MCHCIYSAIQLPSCKCVFNKLSCQCQLSVMIFLFNAQHYKYYVQYDVIWCDVCVTDCCAGCSSNVLQVGGLPAGLPCSQLDSYLSDLVACFSVRRFDIVRDSWHVPSSSPSADTVDACCVLAVFDSDEAALTALTCQSSSKYRLQPYSGWARHGQPSLGVEIGG